jgi:hypothetical protein
MVTKRRIGRKSINAKFRKQNKTKVRKTVKLTKSKRHNKKRNHKTKRRYQKGGNDDECPICKIDFEKDENGNIIGDIITLNDCRHKFHRPCLIQWCQTKGPGMCTCPMDRNNISEEMAQYMPASNNPPVVNNIVNQIANPIPNPNYISSDSDDELSENSNIDRLEIFQGETNNLLNSMPYEQLPEAPYLAGANLPPHSEGGPRDRIKNLLICLFSNENYFYNNFNFFRNCRDLNMEIVDDDDEEGVERLKVAIISTMMSGINDNLNYRHDHLTRKIIYVLERCAADALGLSIVDNVPQVLASR